MTRFVVTGGLVAFAAGLLLPLGAAILVGLGIIGWAALHTEVGEVSE